MVCVLINSTACTLAVVFVLLFISFFFFFNYFIFLFFYYYYYYFFPFRDIRCFWELQSTVIVVPALADVSLE